MKTLEAAVLAFDLKISGTFQIIHQPTFGILADPIEGELLKTNEGIACAVFEAALISR